MLLFLSSIHGLGAIVNAFFNLSTRFNSKTGWRKGRRLASRIRHCGQADHVINMFSLRFMSDMRWLESTREKYIPLLLRSKIFNVTIMLYKPYFNFKIITWKLTVLDSNKLHVFLPNCTRLFTKIKTKIISHRGLSHWVTIANFWSRHASTQQNSYGCSTKPET